MNLIAIHGGWSYLPMPAATHPGQMLAVSLDDYNRVAERAARLERALRAAANALHDGNDPVSGALQLIELGLSDHVPESRE